MGPDPLVPGIIPGQDHFLQNRRLTRMEKVLDSFFYRAIKALEYTCSIYTASFISGPWGLIPPAIGTIPNIAQTMSGYFALAKANQSPHPTTRALNLGRLGMARGLTNGLTNVAAVLAKTLPYPGLPFNESPVYITAYSLAIAAESLALVKASIYDIPPKWAHRQVALTALTECNALLKTHLNLQQAAVIDGGRKMAKKSARNLGSELISDGLMFVGRTSLIIFAAINIGSQAETEENVTLNNPLMTFLFLGLALYLIGAVKRVLKDNGSRKRQKIQKDISQQTAQKIDVFRPNSELRNEFELTDFRDMDTPDLPDHIAKKRDYYQAHAPSKKNNGSEVDYIRRNPVKWLKTFLTILRDENADLIETPDAPKPFHDLLTSLGWTSDTHPAPFLYDPFSNTSYLFPPRNSTRFSKRRFPPFRKT
ncbi:MAG: hypothetical protein ACI9BD_000711 [Candidatus Marinamargulisbacteria bacterium]|jgi:hypothetical protein